MRFVIVALVLLAGCQSIERTEPAAAVPGDAVLDRFDVRTDKWVALHLFAYHATRDRSRQRLRSRLPLEEVDRAAFTPEVEEAFAPVAAAYQAYLESHPLFDDDMFAILRALDEGPDQVPDPAVRVALVDFMPTYETHFWPRHRRAAAAFADELLALLRAHGPRMMEVMADELAGRWGDSGYRVHVAPYVSWSGAFSGANQIYLGALDPELGRHKLEGLFHEAAHGRPIGNGIRPAAEAALEAHGLEQPRFWHFLLFTAAGRAAQAIYGPDHIPYSVDVGLTEAEGSKPYYDALHAVWDEHDTLEARAMAAAGRVAAGR